MNIFEQIKSAVSTKDAAIFYGIRVSRNGMCCCPFHPDRHPSMKVDNRFHCFGCGADGDVINFVERLDGLVPIDAARKLASDFNIPIAGTLATFTPAVRAAIEKQNSEKEQLRAFQLYKRDALNFLRDYYRVLHEAWRDLAPTQDEGLDNCHPLFEEALNNMKRIDEMISDIENSSLEDSMRYLNIYKEDITHVRERLNNIYAGN